MNQSFEIPVHLNSKLFRQFAIFDGIKRTKRLRGLFAFSALTISAGALAFFLGEGVEEGASTLVIILVGIGVLLPVLYLGTFMRSIRYQIRRFGLDKGRHVYTLNLSPQPDGIKIQGDGEEVAHAWKDIFALYRLDGCMYLYVHPRQAFLLPEVQITAGAENLWTMLKQQIASEKVFDQRKSKS